MTGSRSSSADTSQQNGVGVAASRRTAVGQNPAVPTQHSNPNRPVPKTLSSTPATDPTPSRSDRAFRFVRAPERQEQNVEATGPGPQRALLILGFVAVVGLLLWTGQAPERLAGVEPTEPPGAWLPIALAAVAAVSLGGAYRPFGGLLGFGALPLPWLAMTFGSPAAAVVAFLGSLGAVWWSIRLVGRDPAPPLERRGRRRVLLDATHTGIATLAAGTAWASLRGVQPVAAALVATLIWAALAHGLDGLQRRRRRRSVSGSPRIPLPALWDTAGWILAAAVAIVAARVGAVQIAPLVCGFLLLTTVGAVREADRRRHLRRIRDLQHVGSVSQRMTPEDGVAKLAESCLSEARGALHFQVFEIELRTEDGTEIFHATTYGPLLEGAAEVAPNPPPAPGIHMRREWKELSRRLSPASASEAQNVELGYLRLWIDPREAGEHDDDLFADLCAQIAAHIDRARLDREARIDQLTGLTRRHIFDRELERRFALAQKEGHAVALLLFDLDHFKQVNDTHGHEAGDRVLEATGAVLHRAADPGGLACRWGGEELALLLWNGGKNALVFADELRRFLAEQAIPTRDGEIRVTTSVGVAAFPDLLVHEAQDLVECADQALYAAKEAGRNQALLACGRGRFKSPTGEMVGGDEPLAREQIPTL